MAAKQASFALARHDGGRHPGVQGRAGHQARMSGRQKERGFVIGMALDVDFEG